MSEAGRTKRRNPSRKQPTGRKRCSACAHPNIAAIDVALASRAPLTDVAATYSIGRMTLARHKETCLTAAVASAATARERRTNAATILDDWLALQKRTTELLDRAEANDDTSIADVARVVRESRENLTTLGKLIGAFPKEAAADDHR